MKMWRWIKDTFIPHHANDHKPRLFEERVTVGCVAGLLLLLVISVSSTVMLVRSGIIAAVYPSVLVELANDVRAEEGAQPLARSDRLERAAKLKAEHMAAHDYFAHQSPDGVTPWHWLRQAEYRFVYAGENLAIDFDQSRAVNTAWLNSPKHRDNIVDNRFSEVGIAVHQGEIDGRRTTFVVQMFGTPVTRSTPNADTSQQVAARETQALSPDDTAQPQQEGGRSEATSSGGVSGVAAADRTRTPASTSAPSAQASVATSSPPDVAATGTLTVLAQDERFMAVQNTAVEEPAAVTTERTVSAPWRSMLTSIVMNPAHVFDVLFGIVAAVVVLVLGAMITIEIKKQHPRHIAHGVLLLVITVSFLAVNHMLVTLLVPWA